ncbi:hypothetical protein C8R47DRAFT_1276472 [Mycena vitilis]|nr:hypothetical protein C8R47DRAFT_1276472 [Mycena vitilis]
MHIKSPFPPLRTVPETNIHNVLFGRPSQAEWADFTIQIDDNTGRKRTFMEMKNTIGLGATALGANVADGGLGLSGGGGELVGLLGFNSLSQEYFDIAHSLLMITTPFALISTYSTRFELVHALRLIKATRLFVDAKLLKNVLAATEDLDVCINPEHIYILAGSPPCGRRSFRQMVDSVQRKNVPLEPVRPAKKDTLAYLIMSSGTSGLPKAVMTTHGNVICSIIQGMAIAPRSKEPKAHSIPVTLAVLPMFHSYGLHAYILRATLYRATYVILDKWETAHYLQCIPKYRVTQLSLIPSAIHQLVNHPDTKNTDMSSIVYINSGAAYLPPALAAQFSRFLKNASALTQTYGLSETTLTALARPTKGTLGLATPPPTATGVLIPGLEARIVCADGSDAAVGNTGELWLRGENVVPGYWNNAQATADAFVDGWLRTGDQFRADKDGHLFFADRRKDTLKVSGIQVSPMEIEDVLLAHPAKLIGDVAVAGVSGGRTTDEKVPRAWVVLSAAGKERGVHAVIEALEIWHKESLSKYKWLRGGIEVVDELPKTPTGKTIRRVLQDEYERRARAKL